MRIINEGDPVCPECGKRLAAQGGPHCTVHWQWEENPPKPGYHRLYNDHTGRWYDDMSPEQYEAEMNDPRLNILRDEINKEILREIRREIMGGLKG